MAMREKSREPGKRRRGIKSSSLSRSTNTSDTSSARNTLLIKLSEDAPSWYKVAETVPGRNEATSSDLPSRDIVEKYRHDASDLLRKEVQLFGTKGDTKDMSWIQSTISKGTLKDRIAAMSVVVSTHPVHKFHALDGLLQMAGCLSEGQANSRVAQLAAEALGDLFVNTFLPADRKLLTLAQRPLNLYEQPSKHDSTNGKHSKRTLSPRVLLLWRFEEMVKEKYNLFVRQYLGYTLREAPEQQKISALRLASMLLSSVPEGEAVVLHMMCNKLGDPEKKVAAAAAHEMRNVLNTHPAMRDVVAREVQQLAHRPHLSSRALYNCITFLNQLTFTRHDISKDNGTTPWDSNAKSPSPRTKSLPASLISTYFRLFEVTMEASETSVMKGRLLSALLSGVNRAHPFLPAKDQELDSHLDALYRVVLTAPPAACTQALLLLFHVAVGSKLDDDDKSNSSILRTLSDEEKARQERFYQTLYSRLSRAELLHGGKHMTMLFNLIYKAMKYDRKSKRVVAFTKQLLSTTMHCPPQVAAGSIFLLNEVAKYHPQIIACFASLLPGPCSTSFLDFRSQVPLEALMVHRKPVNVDDSRNESDLSPLWEMSLLYHHHHPSVANFAAKLGGLDYRGDPLKDFALPPFLDKFAYRNPKSTVRIENKLDQARKSIAARHSDAMAMAERERALPVNDPSFLEKKDVPVQDKFFHHFFSERAKRNQGVTDRSAPKKDAVDMEDVEVDIMDSKDFTSYEQNWESDEEEDAYVDHLAQKVMEDSMDPNELGPGDLDDEDPDTSNWDDLDHDEDENGTDDSDENNVNEEVVMGRSMDERASSEDSDDDDLPMLDDDDDAFMDDMDRTSQSSDSQVLSDEEPVQGYSEKSEGMVMEKGHFPIHEDESENDLALIQDDSDSKASDDAAEKPRSKRKKNTNDEAVFASAKDYEEKINEVWNNLTTTAGASTNDGQVVTSNARKKKKYQRTDKRS